MIVHEALEHSSWLLWNGIYSTHHESNWCRFLITCGVSGSRLPLQGRIFALLYDSPLLLSDSCKTLRLWQPTELGAWGPLVDVIT